LPWLRFVKQSAQNYLETTSGRSPADRDTKVGGARSVFSASISRARRKPSRREDDLAESSSDAGFDSDQRDCGVRYGIGVPATGSLLLYFCRRIPRVILLVFVLVSAAIDDKSDFKFKWLWC
jgi:hypothetical protein